MSDPHVSDDIDYLFGPAIASRLAQQGRAIMEQARLLQAAINQRYFNNAEPDPPLPLLSLLRQATQAVQHGHRDAPKPAEQGPIAERLRRVAGAADEYFPASNRAAMVDLLTIAADALDTEPPELADARARAAMFQRRCARYESWWALPPSERHPMGPEYTPGCDNFTAVSTADDGPDLVNPLPPRLPETRAEDGSWTPMESPTAYQTRVTKMLATDPAFAERVRAYAAASVDLAFDKYAAQVDPRPQSVLVGEIESGPLSPAHVIRDGAELATWLHQDRGPDYPDAAVLVDGQLVVGPAPEVAPRVTDMASLGAEVARLFVPWRREEMRVNAGTYINRYAGDKLVKAAPSPDDLSHVLTMLWLEYQRLAGSYAGLLAENEKTLRVLAEAVSEDRQDPKRGLSAFDLAELAAEELKDLRTELAKTRALKVADISAAFGEEIDKRVAAGTIERGDQSTPSSVTVSAQSDPDLCAALGIEHPTSVREPAKLAKLAIGECPKCRRINGPDTDDCTSFYCNACNWSYGAVEP